MSERQRGRGMADREESKPQQQEQEGAQIENGILKTSITTAITAAHSDSSSRRSLQPQISGVLHSLISQAHACQYEFEEYFVAWQGVLTVAFSGIPPSICHLKQNINFDLGECLAGENPGSKWPKISLGCLREEMTLSLEQLLKLHKICTEESRDLAATSPIMVDNLSVVLYANCCLEKTLTVATTPLACPMDVSRPTTEEIGLVRKVLNEFTLENVEIYHSFTSKGGNRSAHYRNSKIGGTLVHFLKSVPVVLAGFRARVDLELPGMYDWFRDDSLHVTVRALF